MLVSMVADPKSKPTERSHDVETPLRALPAGAGRNANPAVARKPGSPERADCATSWDLSRIPLFDHDVAWRPETPPDALQRKLIIGETHDPLEREADRVASQVMRAQSPLLSVASVSPSVSRDGVLPAERATDKKPVDAAPAGGAPVVVDEVLRRPGRPLGEETLAFFERRFGRDFSGVRVHADGLAARSAQAVAARSYTVGNQIVFDAGAYAPEGREGRELIAHELAHTLQQASGPAAWMQRQPALAPAMPAPRHDYVFIMGADRKGSNNPFYAEAARYFRAHEPGATMVEDQRSLDDLLGWIVANVTDAIGNLYIVSHGNEDGTLAFGLNSADADAHLSVVELRDALHPSGGGASTLRSVGGVVDAQTRIHIKGCDIGRTQEMVELIDEAFGGVGTVTAPTHEQGYGTDTALGTQARHLAHDQKMGAFTAGLAAVPEAPPPVDAKLKGEDRKEALKAHAEAAKARKAAQAERKDAVAREETRIKPELDDIAEKATTEESLSGPMFQHPGTQLFTATEMQPELDRVYGHLPETRRKRLAVELAAPDKGGPDNQSGQRIDRIKPFTLTFADPATLAEAKTIYAEDLADKHFTPKTFTSTAAADGTVVVLTGTTHPPGGDAYDDTVTYPPLPLRTDAPVIEGGKAQTNNPGRYAWRVERTHNSRTGITTLTAIGERVKAYLHHGSLDAGAHDHFIRPEGDADFYATSTFAPPPP